MATVYFGRSPGGRRLAVKVMHADLAADAAHRAWFTHEVAAARAAGGRWSPALIDADPAAATPWLATEYLPAVSLRDAVSRFGPLTPEAACVCAAAMAEALRALHGAGVVHLDLKPGNVLLTRDGPRLIDFGIARTGNEPRDLAGSRGYMAPELIAGGEVGPAADVYALGATLSYALSRPGPSVPGVPDEALAAVVEACMRPRPADRPTTTDLIARLTAEMQTRGCSAADGLPPGVAAEIDAQVAQIDVRAAEVDARAADVVHPPTTRVRSATRRAVLRLGAATLVGGAGAAGGWALWPRRPGHDPGPSIGSPAASSRAPSSAPTSLRRLAFELLGDGTLPTLTYTVNGQTTTLNDVKLPWDMTFPVAPLPLKTAWRLRFRLVPGHITYSVYIDDLQLVGGETNGAPPAAEIDKHGEN
jgi:hypothetical protein